jgi:hypothetical protein
MRDTLSLSEFNTEFVLRDSSGKIKKLWNPNRLGRLSGLRIPGITGSYKDSFLNHNGITNAGHAAANARMSGQGAYAAFANLAIGIGTTAFAPTQTALITESTTGGAARGAATASQTTTTVANDTTQLTKTFTFSATLAITEEGIFDNASTGGTMLARNQFAAINVVSGDSLTITHSYQT